MDTCKRFEPRFDGQFAVSVLVEVYAHYVRFWLHAHIKQSVPIRDGWFSSWFSFSKEAYFFGYGYHINHFRNHFCNREQFYPQVHDIYPVGGHIFLWMMIFQHNLHCTIVSPLVYPPLETNFPIRSWCRASL